MQCPSCRFENIPGVESCGRCGTSLRLATAVIDVHPPRAKPWAKRARALVPRRSAYRLRDAAAEAAGRTNDLFVRDLRVPLPARHVAARLIVPGWAHLRCGQVVRGRAFLLGYLAVLLPGLAAWGTAGGPLLLGLAFSVHAAATLNFLLQERLEFPSLVATTALVWAVLALGVYLPAGWVLGNLAMPRRFGQDAAPFEAGDVVLVNRWAFAWSDPRPGDVVLYRPAEGATVATRQEGHTRYLTEEEERIDRVLARPGDRVRWERGRLWVNHVEVPWRPLNPDKVPPRLEFTVPLGRYLVLPTASRGDLASQPQDRCIALGSVAAGDIVGGAYLRNWPAERLWFIR